MLFSNQRTFKRKKIMKKKIRVLWIKMIKNKNQKMKRIIKKMKNRRNQRITKKNQKKKITRKMKNRRNQRMKNLKNQRKKEICQILSL